MAILIISAIPVGASGPPPKAAISCQGCVNMEQVSAAEYTAFVRAGATITLSGNPGYQTYTWTQNGLRMSGTQKIAVTIVSSTQYALTVTDSGGIGGGAARSDTRAIQINLVSAGPQNIGVPDLSEIEIDNIYISVGDRIHVKIFWSNDNNYANINFYWEIESDYSGLAIENKNSKETWIKVLAKPSDGKNPVIKAIITNGKFWSEKTVTVVVVDNTAPIVKGRYTYTTPLSHTGFEVSCGECWTGNGYNENSDFISEFTAILRDTKNHAVSSGTVTAKRGQTLSTITLKPGDEGKYLLEVTAKDSHGLSATFEEQVFVGFGNTEKDVPFIIVNDTLFCEAGKPCSIDLSRTYTYDLGVRIRFNDITAPSRQEPLYNTGGALCTTFNCTTIFRYPYTYRVRITMAYVRNGAVADKSSEKIITVVVGESEKREETPAQTATPIAGLTARPLPVATTPPLTRLTPQLPPEVPAKPTPGLNPVAIFAVLIAAAMLQGGKKNKH
ncbi:hypothetical protein KJ695_00020 [Patescibacteria group bacterium]|nr:hypothetical protein [Patescibacteria group bacterium]MBU4056287.1 hypothetical protein [Patescibacteria group bacterium]